MEGLIIDSDNDDIVMDNGNGIMMENCGVVNCIFCSVAVVKFQQYSPIFEFRLLYY